MNGQKKKTLKIIVLSFLVLLGTLIILLASLVVYNLFFTPKVQGGQLSRSLSDVIILYEDSQSRRDLPKGLALVDSSCHISQDKKSFTYTLTLKSNATTRANLALQVFVGENFVKTYGSRVVNPIVQVLEDEAYAIEAGAEQSFTFTGVLYGEGEDAVETLKAAMDMVYLEVFFADKPGRIQLPVRFV